MAKHKKITIGFVVQDYDEVDGKLVCQSQEFVAGGCVDYEDEDGNTVEIDFEKEQYQPFDMVQPE